MVTRNKLQQALQKQTLISTYFSISSHEQETQRFHSPKVFPNYFPTLESTSKREQTIIL